MAAQVEEMSAPGYGVPRRTLSTTDAVSIIIGIVIGAGIFRTPSLVAANSGTEEIVLLLWALGGLLSFVGALCYAELATAFPNAGGDYHFLRRAFGENIGFLFAWGRLSVIQTGSIAMIAFLVGDYATDVFPLGDYSSSWYSVLTVVLLTAINAFGMKQGKGFQNVMSLTILLGLVFVIVAGVLWILPRTAALSHEVTSFGPGKAMIFVLLTYGGWNEASYISAEIRDSERNIVKALLVSIVIITSLYLAANFLFLKVLGLQLTANTETVAAEFMRVTVGEAGATFISLLIIVASLATLNGSIITGARTGYAFGRDFGMHNILGRWNEMTNTPAHALAVQAAVALALIAFGSASRSGFVAMVEYTAPVFWFFFFLVGVSLIVLRLKEPSISRPFKVPLYPITPLVFCIFCLFMLRSSIAYAGYGSLAGIVFLIVGVPLLFLLRRRR
jgi:basic amino acid/polyamine antiporter, APA family